MNFTEIHPSHEDIVNDIVFDCHGKRFATCSNDRHIRVWEKEEQSDTWLFVDFPKGHKDSVWRLSWADPEYGQIIASCGEDGSICIFEEHLPITASESATWVKKVQLAISKKAVNDVKFAQKKFGLILATASADGYVRIYEATDIFDLSNWEKLVRVLCVDSSYFRFYNSRLSIRSRNKLRILLTREVLQQTLERIPPMNLMRCRLPMLQA